MCKSFVTTIAATLLSGSAFCGLPQDVSQIALQGQYKGHLQDVWYDGGGFLYWAHTLDLLKTDLSGRIVRQAKVKGHHAGIEVRNGKVYVAVCPMQSVTNGKTTPDCRVTINEYDADTLKLLKKNVTGINDRSGSLAILEDGTFLVGCLRPQDIKPTQVRFHHLDRNYRLIKSYVLDDVPVVLGIEVIRVRKDGIYLCMYNFGDKLPYDCIKLDFSFKEVWRGKLPGACGLVFDGDDYWCGVADNYGDGTGPASCSGRLVRTFRPRAPGESELPLVQLKGSLGARFDLTVEGLSPCARLDGKSGKMRLGGRIGAKMNTFLAQRLLGEEAKGRIYEEAVEAFRTHYDDVRTPEQDAVEGWTAGKGLWQGEYWGKTMLSAAVVAENQDNAALKSWLKEKSLAFVKEFQRADGYLGSYLDPYYVGGPVPGKPGEAAFCWNLWGRKYTLWALLEVARVTDTPELVEAAHKIMDQWMAQLAEKGIRIEDTGYFVGLPSMSVLKPLLLLYRATGNAKYFAYAETIVAAWTREGNPPPNLVANAFSEKLVHTWYAQPEYWAKAYEMMSCLEGLVDYADMKREPRVLEAVERIVAKLEAGELNAVGGVGFFDHFTHAAACPNATTEPCDVTHWIRINRDLFMATGRAHYLDNIEFAFYNAFLAGVYRDGTWGAHSVRSHGTRHRTAPHQVGMKYHQCCIDNMPRTFVDFADTVLTRGSDGILSVNFYSDATGVCEEDKVAISGGYPFGNVVTVRVTARKPGRVRFRRPSWFDGMSVNGLVVAGDWFVTPLASGENVFRLTFERSVRIVDARSCVGNDARADGFELAHENPEMKGLARTKPAARLLYGPLLLAKSKRLGVAREETFDAQTVNGCGYSCELVPLPAAGVDGAWTATFSKGDAAFSVKVCDFASAADEDDPSNWFSIWF